MKRIALPILLFLFLLSCKENHIYHKYNKIPDYIWNENYTVTFPVSVRDTSSVYNVYFNIRNASFYPFSNIWVICEKTDPSGNKLFHKRFEFTLASIEGKWLGKGIGDIIDNHFILEENVRFREKGLYQYTFYQNMRTSDLPGIMDIGLEMVKDNE